MNESRVYKVQLAVAGDEEIPEDVVNVQDPNEDDEELSLQYIPLSLSLSDGLQENTVALFCTFDAKVTNSFQTPALDEQNDKIYQEVENFLHSLLPQEEDRNSSKRIPDSIYWKETSSRDMYTPDFDSDSDNLQSMGSSCSSASGSFECLNLKDLEPSAPVVAQKLLNKEETEKNASRQWDSEESEEDIDISQRHLNSDEMENFMRIMSPTFENPQENDNSIEASSDYSSFSALKNCSFLGSHTMIPKETNSYNQQFEMGSQYLQSNLLSKSIEEETCDLDNSTSRCQEMIKGPKNEWEKDLNMNRNIRIHLGKIENFDEENGSYQETPALLHSSVLDGYGRRSNQETLVALNPSVPDNCQFSISDDKNETNYPDISSSQNFTKPQEENESHKNFPRNQLQNIQEIGSGWFGQVLEGEAQNIIPPQRKTKVVVKILREDASPSERASFLHEVRPFRDLNHPNIVHLLSQCLETDPFLILMEHFTMDMKAFLIQHRHDSEQLQKEGGLLSMACDIANALQHMHEHGFIWIDVATRNCVVSVDLTVKIGEYGTSIHKYKDDYYSLGDVTLPVRWCAPESVLCTKTTIEIKELTKESNIWSFGVLLWETVEFGRQPYTNLTDEEVLQKVISQQTVQLEKPRTYCIHADKLFGIMKLCWKSVCDRPMIQKVAALLKYLYENKDVPSDSSTFEIKWNALQNISKDHNISVLSSPSKIHMRFENDFILNNKHELQKEREKLTEMEYSCEEISPSQESLSTEDKIGFRINSHISQSLQNLRGSIDDLNEDKQFQSMESLDCTEIQERKISYPESPERSSYSSITAQQISDAIKDLDNMLANEASSSGETSKRTSPKKNWENEDTWNSDPKIEGNSSVTYNQFPFKGLHVKDSSNWKPCAWSETSRMISDIDSENTFVQFEKNYELVSNKDEFKNVSSQEKSQAKNKIECMQLYTADLDQSNDWVGLPSLENKSELDKYTFVHHSNKEIPSEELEEQQIEIKKLCLPITAVSQITNYSLPDQQEIMNSSDIDYKLKFFTHTENYNSQSLSINAKGLLSGSACEEELLSKAAPGYVSACFDNTSSCINASITVTSPICIHPASVCTSAPAGGGLISSTSPLSIRN
ncbi:uncharacterized protein LOC111086409 [Limulus polyphemus]|uniref:Uncharacterized protein LOC111086409 n=1 Tax=Limulus polyphemus TaxID=6850 RepID=A0ABM1SMH4_LIMPO|nr:uncharacterized protein LOC111086409 [Limulus polyphemus]